MTTLPAEGFGMARNYCDGDRTNQPSNVLWSRFIKSERRSSAVNVKMLLCKRLKL